MRHFRCASVPKPAAIRLPVLALVRFLLKMRDTRFFTVIYGPLAVTVELRVRRPPRGLEVLTRVGAGRVRRGFFWSARLNKEAPIGTSA